MAVKVTMNTKAVKAAIRTAAQPRLAIAADHLRIHLAEQLASGALPIHDDTQTLGISISVQTPQSNDSDIRIKMAGQAYVQGGRWTDPVRKEIDPDAYTQEHFAQRIAPNEPLTGGGVRARVFTRLAYGFWWYYGHDNYFTQRYEGPRDWFYGPAVDWSKSNIGDYFKALNL